MSSGKEGRWSHLPSPWHFFFFFCFSHAEEVVGLSVELLFSAPFLSGDCSGSELELEGDRSGFFPGVRLGASLLESRFALSCSGSELELEGDRSGFFPGVRLGASLLESRFALSSSDSDSDLDLESDSDWDSGSGAGICLAMLRLLKRFNSLPEPSLSEGRTMSKSLSSAFQQLAMAEAESAMLPKSESSPGLVCSGSILSSSFS